MGEREKSDLKYFKKVMPKRRRLLIKILFSGFHGYFLQGKCRRSVKLDYVISWTAEVKVA